MKTKHSWKLCLPLALLALGTCAQASDAALPSYAPDLVMNWAEATFPDVFPGHAADQAIGSYVARGYSSGNYLGVSNGRVYFYAPGMVNGPQDVGAVSDYYNGAIAAGFPTLAQRTAAANAAAANSADCTAVAPFYWEIGDKGQALASGSQGNTYNANSLMSIASASKMLYGAYVVQKRGGASQLNTNDTLYLNFQSGYTDFTDCAVSDSVHSCATSGTNGVRDPNAVGKFYYSGGHMEQHADQFMNLGAMTDVPLTSEVKTTLGLTTGPLQFEYSQPQLAGGMATTPAVYAQFLRRILDGSLLMHDALGLHAVCTNPKTCATALSTPWPEDESPSYSIGHWVEDPVTSDGAFSSAGAFGFYPWIDAGKNWYGIVARMQMSGANGNNIDERPGVMSAYCGRRIRTAWMTGSAS